YAGWLFADVLPEVPTSRPRNYFGVGAILWLVGVGLLTRSREKTTSRAGLLGLAVVLVGALGLILRLYDLKNHPFGVWVDEADVGEQTLEMINRDDYRPMFVPGIHMTGIQLFTYAAGQIIFGEHSALSLRLVNVFWGTAGVLVAYGVGKELRGGWFGVLMAFFLATMRWSINFSRVAMTSIDNVFFVLLTLYFALRLVKHGTLRDALGLAASVGFGLWFYGSFRFAIVPIFIFVLVRWPYWKSRPKTAFLFSVVGLTILLLAAPLLIFARKDPDLFSQRSRETFIFYEENRGEDETIADVLRYNIPRYLEMFHFVGDTFGRHNLPDAPMLDVLSGLLFLVGIWYAVKNDDWLFVLLLAAALITGIITVKSDTPQANRVGAAMIPVAFFCALAVETWGQKLMLWRVPRAAVWSMGAGVLVLVAYLNMDTYFDQQRHDYRTWASFSTHEKLFADAFNQRSDHLVLMSRQPPFLMDSLVANFVAKELTLSWQENPFRVQQDLPLRTTGETSLFFMPGESTLFDYARWLYPAASGGAVYLDAPDLRDRPENIPLLFYVLDIPADDVARLQGVSDEGYLYAPAYGTYFFRFSGRLILDGQPVEPENPIRLYQGLHTVQTDGGAIAWSTPEFGAYVTIPETMFFHDIGEVHGLMGTYYASDDWTGQPEIVRIDLTPNMYFHELPLPRPYSIEWTGRLLAPDAGSYIFDLRQVGYTEVYLDGELILTTDKPDRRIETEVELTSGLHDLLIRYQDTQNASQIYIGWQPPNGERVPLPPLNLFPE
ncbi:MAG: glycosyltransferase family 39 protein, partial [Anaerolineae bacterium]|nr:glycosyltransferase family 39 protein [Anaerolineae bacterium]